MLNTSSQIPNATVARLEDEDIVTYEMRDLFDDGLYILVGLPGAFTPICTQDHIPSLIKNADQFRAKGIQDIFCISDDNVWALKAWTEQIPGSEKITFLSDGNREFLKESGLVCDEDNLFLKGKYARFYALIENGKIKRMRQEITVLKTVCTSGECIFHDLDDFI